MIDDILCPTGRKGGGAFGDQRDSHMNEISKWPQPGAEADSVPAKPSRRIWPWAAAIAVIALGAAAGFGFSHREVGQVAEAAIPPAPVTVSKPLLANIDTH